MPRISTIGDGKLPMSVRTWTWREAIEVASRVRAHVTIRRDDLFDPAGTVAGPWLATWRERPVVINAPA